MTDTTTARRQLLTLLLDRVDRDALLHAERPLLRACVAAEQGAADARESVMEHSYVERADQAEAAITRVRAALQPRSEDDVTDWQRGHRACSIVALDALDHERPAAARPRYWRGTDGIDIGTAYMDAQATLARVHRAMATPPELPYDSLYDRGWTDAMSAITRALDGPSPTPDDAPSCQDSEGCHRVVPCDPGCATHPARATPPTTDDAQATADRAALDNAIAELPELASDRAVYGDRTGQMLGVLAGSAAPGTLAFCSPLVNAACPGHTGPPYCDRAPSNPITPAVTPVWVPDDNRPCPTQFDDGDCAGTWMHPGDCTTNADDIPSTQEADRASRRCPAQFTGSPDRIAHCELPLHHGGPHGETISPTVSVTWPDSFAVYPVDDAPSEPQP